MFGVGGGVGGGGGSSSKKRRTEKGTPTSSDADDPQPPPPSSRRHLLRSPEQQQPPPPHATIIESAADFERAKALIYRARVEELNRAFLQCLSDPAASATIPNNNNNNNDSLVCWRDAVHEYQRCLRQTERLFGNAAGGCDLVGCGSNEYSVLTEMASPHDPTGTAEYVDTFALPPQRLMAAQQLGSEPVQCAAAGGMASYVVTVTGRAVSFGASDDGALGRRAVNENEGVPVEIRGFVAAAPRGGGDDGNSGGLQEDGTVIDAVGGASHALFLTLRGNVYMCGMLKDGDSGTFHNVDDDDSGDDIFGGTPRPVHVPLPGRVAQMATKGSCNAVLLDDGVSIYTWGFGNSGELARTETMTTPGPDGNYDITPQWYKDPSNGDIDAAKVKEHFLTPKPVLYEGIPVKRTVLSIAMGTYHFLVAARDPGQFQAKTYSSGLNTYGQTGHGDPKDVGMNFHKLKLIQSLQHENIGQVAAGETFSLALSHDGRRLYSFGRADKGQTGVGVTETNYIGATPRRVRFPAGYANPDTGKLVLTQIAAGETHALAVDDAHQLYSWGFNESCACGHDASNEGENDVVIPTKLDLAPILFQRDNVTEVVHVHAVSGGAQHSLFACRRYRQTVRVVNNAHSMRDCQ